MPGIEQPCPEIAPEVIVGQKPVAIDLVSPAVLFE